MSAAATSGACPACPSPEAKAHRHMLEALREFASKPCNRRNCGTVCLCGSCHARKALEYYDPTWRP